MCKLYVVFEKNINISVTIIIMGRDFDIRIYLEIEHKHGISYYELPCIGGYFF